MFYFIEIDESKGDEGYHLNDEKSHEAGYDAFITGVVFLSMSHYLGKLLISGYNLSNNTITGGSAKAPYIILYYFLKFIKNMYHKITKFFFSIIPVIFQVNWIKVINVFCRILTY